MRRYKYKAKEKKTGKAVKGLIQAENEQTAGRLLIDQGYIPESISEEKEGLFGGGGHVLASGCVVNGYYEDCISKILKSITDGMED